MTADDSLGETWLAIGLDLTLVSAGGGGRRTALVLREPFRYRPNWGLPGMTGTDQTGAPVLPGSGPGLNPAANDPNPDYQPDRSPIRLSNDS